MAFPIVRFDNNDVTLFLTSTSVTEFKMTAPDLPAGEYLVTVINECGISNAIPFSIVEDIDPEDAFGKITDHVLQANERLLHQYRQPHIEPADVEASTQVSKLLQALYTEGIQSLETISCTIITKLLIDQASGTSLDMIGEIIGQPRNNLSDTAYRIYLTGKVAVNNSNGLSDDIYKVWNAFSFATETVIDENFPAGISINSDTSPDITYIDVIKDYINRALGAGISLSNIIIYDPVDAFQLASVANPSIDPLHGYSSTLNPTTGGKLAKVI